MVALILCATVIIQTKATPFQRERWFEPKEGELYEDDSDSVEDVLQEFYLDSYDKSRMYESPMDEYGYGESRMDGYDEYPNGYDAASMDGFDETVVGYGEDPAGYDGAPARYNQATDTCVNPCENGNFTTELNSNTYNCSCEPGWVGNRCELANRNLRVTVSHGRDLIVHDRKFVRITAYNSDGSRHPMGETKRHDGIFGYVKWDYTRNFGVSTWKELKIQVFRKSIIRNSPVKLLGQKSFSVYLGNRKGLKLKLRYGYIKFGYKFE